MKSSHATGFTLIEAVIYIGLFSLIMSGALVGVYDLIVNAQGGSAGMAIEEEGSFVERKIDWALSSATSISLPHANELLVSRSDGTTVDIKRSGTSVVIEENGALFSVLTTNNVAVTNLAFQMIGSSPVGVSATTTINGRDFEVTRYLRK